MRLRIVNNKAIFISSTLSSLWIVNHHSCYFVLNWLSKDVVSEKSPVYPDLRIMMNPAAHLVGTSFLVKNYFQEERKHCERVELFSDKLAIAICSITKWYFVLGSEKMYRAGNLALGTRFYQSDGVASQLPKQNIDMLDTSRGDGDWTNYLVRRAFS